MTSKFEIRKTTEYVWRYQITGAGHNYITCWHVYDAQTGEMVVGGHRSGNNQRSGEAEIGRRKDAKAFIAGYEAAAAGEEGIQFNEKYTIADVDRSVHVTHGLDRKQSIWFNHGVVQFYVDQMKGE